MQRGGGRVQGGHGPGSPGPDFRQGPLEVTGAFHVDGDQLPGLEVQPVQHGFRLLRHEVEVQGNLSLPAELLDAVGSKGQVGDEVAVHQVHVEIVHLLADELRQNLRGVPPGVDAHHGGGEFCL